VLVHNGCFETFQKQVLVSGYEDSISTKIGPKVGSDSDIRAPFVAIQFRFVKLFKSNSILRFFELVNYMRMVPCLFHPLPWPDQRFV
jgi:hypothetical protein